MERSKVCKICTFLNFPSAKRCSLCSTVFAASSFNEAYRSSLDGDIRCPSCTIFNEPDASRCFICDTLLFADSGEIQEHKAPEQEEYKEPEEPNEPESFKCSSCEGEFQRSGEGYYGLQRCRHAFCKACIVRHVGEILSSKQEEEALVHLVCPVSDCLGPLTRQDIRAIAGKSIMHQLDDLVLKTMERATKGEEVNGEWNEEMNSLYLTLHELDAAYKASLDVKVEKHNIDDNYDEESYEDDDDDDDDDTTKEYDEDVVVDDDDDTTKEEVDVDDMTKEEINVDDTRKEEVDVDDTRKEEVDVDNTTEEKVDGEMDDVEGGDVYVDGSHPLVDETEKAMALLLTKLSNEIMVLGSKNSLPYLVTVLLHTNPAVTNVLHYLLRNDSTMDIVEHVDLYFQVFALFRALSRSEELFPLLLSGDYDLSEPVIKEGSILSLLQKLHKQASFFLTHQMQSKVFLDDDKSMMEVALVSEVKSVFENLQRCIQVWRQGLSSSREWFQDADIYFKEHFPVFFSGAEKEEILAKRNSEEEAYISMLKDVQFAEASLLESHYFREAVACEDKSSSKKRALRIAKEVATLSTGLPLEFHSSIHVRCDEMRMDVMRALIIGPEDTPYQNGIFLFDIYLNEMYPDVPPKVQYLTTGGGKIRFNPNLYESGMVCLSLLGTWDGPCWQPGASTLMQVLVSLQSLVLVKEPYYNEPGFEKGNSDSESEYYNKKQMYNTLMYSMLPALTQPDEAFRSVIEAHFKGKRNHIEAQCDEWAKIGWIKEDQYRGAYLFDDDDNVDGGGQSGTLNMLENAAVEVKRALSIFLDGPAS